MCVCVCMCVRVCACACECVCVYVCVTDCSGRLRYGISERISPWNGSTWSSISNCILSMGIAVVWKKALSRVKRHLVDRPQFAHPRTLPKCSLPWAAVRGHLQFRSRLNEVWETEVETDHTDVDHERDGGHLRRLTRRPQIGKRFKMWNAGGSKVRICLSVVSDCHNLRAPVFLYVCDAVLCYEIWYDIMFIDCSWVSTQWQWSVNLYKNRKKTAIYKTRNSTQNKNTGYTKYKTKIKNKKIHKKEY